jgi:hypothetical protein
MSCEYTRGITDRMAQQQPRKKRSEWRSTGHLAECVSLPGGVRNADKQLWDGMAKDQDT